MENIISKELLSEVLPKLIICESTEVEVFKSEFNSECLRVSNGLRIFTINIYELAHMCKKWAYKQGYSLNVFNSDSNYYEVTPNTLSDDNEEWVEHPYSIASSEPQGIFKACQWILDNKGK